MTECPFERLADGTWHCEACGYTSRSTAAKPPRCICPTSRTGPPLVKRAQNAAEAYARFATEGGRLLNQEAIDERLVVCSTCELFNGQICTHANCGCPVTRVRTWRNKLALSTEECPLGKWLKVS